MKKFDFQELVDQNLSGLVWDEGKRRTVLQAVRKEERPVKKLSTTFILIAAIVCLSVTALAAGLVGITLGLIGGWAKSWGAFLTVRSVEIIMCFPPVLLALLVVTLLGPGAATLILVLSVLYLPGFARVTYAEVLAVKGRDYVEATRALGARPAHLLFRTVLPNIAGPLLVQFSLAVAAAVVVAA